MAEGSDTYKGLAVPLFGDFEIKQRTAANDIMSITGASGQSGDFIVCQQSDGTEVFAVDSGGQLVAADFPVFNGTVVTTAPTTGLTTGELFWYDAANVRTLAVASGAGTLWRVAMTNN